MIELIVFLLLTAWWISGSPWPILPFCVLSITVFGFIARDEWHWNWPHDFLIVAGLLVLAVLPHRVRLHLRERRQRQRDGLRLSF